MPGFILCRLVIPLWILTGVVFKLASLTPKTLPKNIVDMALESDIDLFFLLFVLVGLEILAIAVMIFIPKLAKPMAIWMMGCFCAILIWEMSSGADSCGCLGGYSPPPWLMLAIDGLLLVGVLITGRPYRTPPGPMMTGVIGAALATAVGVGVDAFRVLPLAEFGTTPEEVVPLDPPQASRGDDPTVPTNPTDPTDPDSPVVGSTTVDPTPVATPTWPAPPRVPNFYSPVVSEWVGKKWNTIKLAQWVKDWPADILEGKAYVIIYSNSCDHCKEFLEINFELGAPEKTVLVTIPETREGFDEDAWLPMMFDKTLIVAERQLPTGCDWFITPPVCVALEDGVVVCAKAGDSEDGTPEDCLIYNW
jgi:hypothetical protein